MYTDFLIKIKNAQMTGKKMMKTRSTRMDKVIAEILQRNGFIESVEVKGRPSKRFMFLDVRAKRKIEGRASKQNKKKWEANSSFKYGK